jgi:hypothetical protein
MENMKETHYVKRTQMSFKLQIVQEIERGQLLQIHRLMAFKIDQLLLNGENSVTLIGKNTIYYVKVAEQKIRSQSKTSKKKLWNDRPLLQIKKSF